MENQSLVIRRRKWKRFIVRSGSIVLLHQTGFWGLGWAKNVELGPVLNVSLRGLMVQYIDSKDRRRKCDELSISILTGGIQVEKIRFETVVDFEVAILPDGRSIRNRSVRFVKMTPYQAFQLETFISAYATGPVQDRRSDMERREATADALDRKERSDHRGGVDRRKE